MVVHRIERLPSGAYVAENAAVTGDVTLAEDVSVWFGCVLRGDDASIRIGARTNLQDLTMVHPDPGEPMTVGEEVTVGHRAILHGVHIDSRCLIGMGAILLAGTRIGEGSMIGAGALVTENTVVPPRSVVIGVPGAVVRDVTDEEYERWILEAAADYVTNARAHAAGRFA